MVWCSCGIPGRDSIISNMQPNSAWVDYLKFIVGLQLMLYELITKRSVTSPSEFSGLNYSHLTKRLGINTSLHLNPINTLSTILIINTY